MLPGSTDIQADRLDRLERMVEKGFEELKQAIGGLDLRLRSLETGENGCRIATDFRITQCQQVVGEIKKQVDTLEKDIEFLLPWVRGLRWGLGILGAAALALVWSLITGQVQVVIK